MDRLTIFGIVMSIIIFVCYLLIVIGTIRRKGLVGINFKRVYCPKCGNQEPLIHPYLSIRENWWGGWTCDKCGCKMDTWGVKLK